MSTKESSTDKKMPLPSEEVREKLLNPDFLNPSSLPDTTTDDDKQLDQSSEPDAQNPDSTSHAIPASDGKKFEEGNMPHADPSLEKDKSI